MNRIHLSIVCATATAAMAGCWPWDIHADEEFKQALPRQEDLVVQIGEMDVDYGSTYQGILDPHANCDECCIVEEGGEKWYVSGDLYELIRAAKWYVNGALVTTFAWIGVILAHPYTEETEHGYLWGPWRESLSRIEFRFAMDKTAARRFSFRLEGRNINAPLGEAWTTIVDGDVSAGGQPHKSTGTIIFDYGAIHGIDVSHPTPDFGVITYDFDVREYPYLVDVTVVDFEPFKGELINGVYRYERLSEGMAGKLGFEALADIWPEDAMDGLLETVVISSSWDSTGKGQADASVHGGSLAVDNIADMGLEECWADSGGLYYQTYRAIEISFIDDIPDFFETGCGSIEHCLNI